MKCKCDNCGDELPQHDLKKIYNLERRVDPGKIVPAGECPKCGAMSYPMIEPVRILWGVGKQSVNIWQFDSESEKQGFLDALDEHDGWLECEVQFPDAKGKFPKLDDDTIAGLMEMGYSSLEDMGEDSDEHDSGNCGCDYIGNNIWSCGHVDQE